MEYIYVFIYTYVSMYGKHEGKLYIWTIQFVNVAL